MDITQIVSLAMAHKWLAVAVVVIGWFTQMTRPESKFPITVISDRWRPLIAAALGIVTYTLTLRQNGETWADAALNGFKTGVFTAGFYSLVVGAIFNGKVPAWANALALIFPPPQPPSANGPGAAPPGKLPSTPPPALKRLAIALAFICALGAIGESTEGCKDVQSAENGIFTATQILCMGAALATDVLSGQPQAIAQQLENDCGILQQYEPQIIDFINQFDAKKKAYKLAHTVDGGGK